MAHGKLFSIETRSAIFTFSREGLSIRNMAKKNVCTTTINLTLQRDRETGSFKDRHRFGQSRITSDAEDKFIKLITKRNKRLTAPDITAEFNRGRDKATSSGE